MAEYGTDEIEAEKIEELAEEAELSLAEDTLKKDLKERRKIMKQTFIMMDAEPETPDPERKAPLAGNGMNLNSISGIPRIPTQKAAARPSFLSLPGISGAVKTMAGRLLPC